MYLSRNGWFEIGAPVLFTLGAFLILHDFNVFETTHHLLTYSLIWLLADLLAHFAFPNPRPLAWGVRGLGGILAFVNYLVLFGESDASTAAFGFAIYTLLFLIISLLYRQPTLFYAFTLTLPLFVTFLFRSFDVTKWIHPVIVLAVIYYAAGYLLRKAQRATGWDLSLVVQRAWAGCHCLVRRTSCRRGRCGNPCGSGGNAICSGGFREEKCLAGFSCKWFVSAVVFHHPQRVECE